MNNLFIMIASLLLTFVGIALLVHSITLAQKLSKINKKVDQISFSLVLILIYLFIIGYLIHLVDLIYNSAHHDLHDLIICLVFFFGGIFVIVSLKENYKLVLKLEEKSDRLETINKELQVKAEALSVSEEKFKKRSEELEKTLDDFYTMRLGMEDQVRRGVLEEENKKIRLKLDELKSHF